MGKILQQLFIVVYTLLKLNLMFWLFSLAGGLIFGIGPALLTMMTLLEDYQWDYAGMSLTEFWQRFKENFKRGNALFYLFAVTMGILAYNLFLAIQIQNVLFLVIVFILMFALVFISLTFAFSQLILARYEIEFFEAVKLGMILFFTNFFGLLKIIGGVALVAFLTYKNLGLLLFGSFSLLQSVIIWSSKGIFGTFEDRYFGTTDTLSNQGDYL